MMQVLGSAARVNGEGTYTDSRDHGKQFSVGRLGNFDKSEETKMTESKILLVLDKKDYEDGMPEPGAATICIFPSFKYCCACKSTLS